ncbi:hypothetical protein [Aeromonas veronii]|uniref:hypothetical protein n=1 Tax=Aeromonas veronii TaxID=654 RepID=UPI003D1B92FD
MAGLSDITVSNFMKVEMKNDSTFVEITDIESWSGFQEDTSIIEVKQFNAKYARKLAASGTVNAVELTCSFIPASASYKALADARTKEDAREFRVTYFNGADKAESSSRTFKGIVASYSEATEFDAQRTCSYTIAVDGELGELKDGVATVKA